MGCFGDLETLGFDGGQAVAVLESESYTLSSEIKFLKELEPINSPEIAHSAQQR
jgi:hypothetical protein